MMGQEAKKKRKATPMKSAAVKAELESALGSRFGAAWKFRERPTVETIATGIAELDALTGGLPRGAVTEICGAASSGRTSLLCAILAAATEREEVCALVDASDAFDPVSAAGAGVDLDRLLWIRCGGNAEHALQATDWLLEAGGFGIVVFDLGDVPPQTARRISLTSWFRLRRAIENTPTVLIAIEQETQAKSCSSLILETSKEDLAWWGAEGGYRLLRSAAHCVVPRKPVQAATARFEAQATNNQ